VYGPVWLKVEVQNPSDSDLVYRIIPLGWLSLFDVEAHLVRTTGHEQLIWRQPVLGNSFDARIPRHRISMSEAFSMSPGETAELWFSFRYGYRADLGYRLVEAQSFFVDHDREHAFHTFLFGARAAIIIFVFLFAAVLNLRIAYYYGLFSVFIYLYFLSQYSYLSYLGVGNLFVNYALGVVFGGLAMTAFTFMTRALLNAREAYPRFDRILLGTLGASWIIGGVSATVIPGQWSMHVLLIAILATAGVNFAGAIFAFRVRIPGSALYLSASVFLLALSVFGGVMILTPFISVPISTGVLHAGFALDTALFALALVSRALALRRERDRATLAELDSLREKSELAARLLDAETAHAHALELSEHHRRKAASTAHDLKQPLLSLRLALTRHAPDDAIGKGLSYLEKIIERDLDESRRADKHPERTALPTSLTVNKLIDSAVTMFADEAALKSSTLSSVSNTLTVKTDPIVLMRILANLVANAVKHTEKGRILVGARRRGNTISIEVHDTGRGVSEADLEALFEPFVKSDESPGEGLGLWVVKALAEEHGLTISVRSRPGRGSVFAVGNIPRGPA
jgi:signal transduction histidine kinase